VVWNPCGQSKILNEDWSEEKEAALKCVLGLYSHVCPHGVGVVIDGTPRPEWRTFAGKRALFCNLGRSGLLAPDRTPPEILAWIREQSWTRLIWISAAVASGEVAGIIWDLAHELRHLEQSQDCPELFQAGGELYRYGLMLWGEDTPWMTVPTEVDCELAAWRVLRELRSPEDARRLVEERAADPEHARNAGILLALDPCAPFAIYDEMLALLREHSTKLGELTQPKHVSDLIAGIERRRRVRGTGVL
jgi:hypothetical protein